MKAIISKFKCGENLTDIEKVKLSAYIRETYGNNYVTGAKELFGAIGLIKFLKFYGIDKAYNEHTAELINPCYKHFCERSNNEIDSLLIEVAKQYYGKITKTAIDKNSMVSFCREYSPKRKEGVLVKKLPYSNGYQINIFGISGNFVFDVGERICEGGKQEGKIFTFKELPTLDNLINSIMIYDLIELNGNFEMVSNDIKHFKAYETAKTYQF